MWIMIKFEFVKDGSQGAVLPLRSTTGSAGYDFFLPKNLGDIFIPYGDKFFFWTNVKVKMPLGIVLILVVRSSVGIKKGLMLTNTEGVIDSDYYGNKENDGNIGISIRNVGEPEGALIKGGDAVAQGIFHMYMSAENCNGLDDRYGGFGSTTDEKTGNDGGFFA